MNAFWTGFHGPLNPPTIITVIVTGLLSGLLIGIGKRARGSNDAFYITAIQGTTLLLAFEAATGISQSYQYSAQSAIYLGNHLGYSVLIWLCGLCILPGCWWAQRKGGGA